MTHGALVVFKHCYGLRFHHGILNVRSGKAFDRLHGFPRRYHEDFHFIFLIPSQDLDVDMSLDIGELWNHIRVDVFDVPVGFFRVTRDATPDSCNHAILLHLILRPDCGKLYFRLLHVPRFAHFWSPPSAFFHELKTRGRSL